MGVTVGDEGGEVDAGEEFGVDEFEGGVGVVEVEEGEVGVQLEGLADDAHQLVQVDLACRVDVQVQLGALLPARQHHPYSYIW